MLVGAPRRRIRRVKDHYRGKLKKRGGEASKRIPGKRGGGG